MAKRRANGEGSIRKRPDGRWEGRYTAGNDPETGKTVYKNVLGKTQAEVKAKLKQAIQENAEVDTLKAEKYTVGQWMDVWFENYAKIRVNPKFCVKSIVGENRAIFIRGGRRGIRLPPFQ